MKKTWKIVCIAVIAILIAILIIYNNTSAYSITLSSNTEVLPGETFTVTLNLSETKSINGYLSYDSNLFTFKTDSNNIGYAQENTPGNIAFMYYDSGSNETTINKITFQFEAKNDASGEGRFDIVKNDLLKVYDVENVMITKDNIACSGVTVKIKELEQPAPQLSINSVSLEIGQTQEITCTNGQTITNWASSDPTIASVNDNGVITANASGSAIITATSSNGKTATVTVTVPKKADVPDQPDQPDPIPPVEEDPVINLSQTAISLKIGDTTKITADVDNITWESSDPSKVIIDGSGNIVALAQGTVTITATATINGKTATATATVTVVEGTNPVINPSGDISLKSGESTQMTADRNVTWSSSDINVATVDATGKITAVEPGTATITATDANQKSTSFKVTVVAEPTNDDNGNGNNNGTGNGETENQNGAGNSGGTGSTTTNKTGNGTTTNANTSSSANTTHPATGESTVETLVILGIVTLIVASVIFRRKSKLK